MAIGLTILTFAGFFLALFSGLRWPKLQLWSWIDAIYYPLAIAGVLLFFFEGSDRRKVLELEDQMLLLKQELAEIEARKPDAEMSLSSPKLVRPGAQWLGVIVDTARSCEEAHLITPKCFVARDLEPHLKPAQRVLATYSGTDDLFGVCVAANELFQGIRDGAGLSSFLTRPIDDHYREGLQKNFNSFDFEAVFAYIEELRPELTKRAGEMIELLSVSEDEKVFMHLIYEAHIDYGIFIMKAMEPCLRAPKDIRNGQYADWNANLRSKVSEEEALEEELRQTRQFDAELNSVEKFRFTFWPFFLVVALVLKFGKGVAHLRKGKLHIRNVFTDVPAA
jgi:hypothetical protein